MVNAGIVSRQGALGGSFNNTWGSPRRFYTRFDGVDDYIRLVANSSFGACTISADLYISDVSGFREICRRGAGYRIFINQGTWELNTTSTGVGVSVGCNHIEVDFDSSENATAFRVNGVEVWTGLAGAGAGATLFYIGAYYTSFPVNEYKGLIYNFSLFGSSVQNFSLRGYGPTPWVDTTGGGSNGTVFGNPEKSLTLSGV